MIPHTIYAIYCKEDKRLIWNARGSAYKNPKDVEKKLSKLIKENPDKHYRIVGYCFSDY